MHHHLNAAQVINADRFELMAEAQRDLTPEQAASRLRECADKHYLNTESL